MRRVLPGRVGARVFVRRGAVWGLVLRAIGALAAEPTVAPGVSLERLELNPGGGGSLLLGTGELLSPGQLRLSTVGHYQHNPLVLSQGGAAHALVGQRLSAHLAAAFSPTRWLELGAQVPLVALQQGEDLSGQGFSRPARSGLSTPSVGARWGLLSQYAGQAADLSLGLSVGLPFGEASGLARAAGLHYLPELSLGRHFGGFRMALSAQALLLGPVPERGQELRLGAVAATEGTRLRWEVNALGTLPLRALEPRSLELLMGPRFLAHSAVELFAMGGVGLGSAPGTPLFRVMVGSAWGGVTPPRLASVSSGPCSPEVKHTARECPDVDDDRDGILNRLDRCPYEMGSLEFSGCPLRDSDGDGIEDSLDLCPAQRGAAEGKGCALPDEDGDGVDNTRDVCPTEAGTPEARGCPRRPWSEKDLKEQEALCSRQKGKRARPGCEDRDGDGIANRFDSCPQAPGAVVNQGCPEEETPLVTLSRSRLELREKVFFVPSQAQLEARSQSQLDGVARVLQEHPEFSLVEVGAHTDNRSFSEANLELSQARAEAVRQYLIQKGVAPERLEARGYGDTVPRDSNDTSIGRENNRRVEFTISGSK